MLSGEYATLYMARWVVGVGLAFICAIALALPLTKKNMAMASMIAIVLFVFVLIGEIMGRAVMFGTNVPVGELLRDQLSNMSALEAFYTGVGL